MPPSIPAPQATAPTALRWLLAGILLVVFGADLLLPLGVAAGVPYVLAVLLSLRSPTTRTVIQVASIATALTLIGYLFSDEGGVLWMVLANRLLAVAMIWLTALFSLERRRVFDTLRETSERLQAILDTAGDGIIVIDDRGLIESFNRRAELLFGYRADEVVGKNVSVLMPSPHGDAHDGYLQRYFETGQERVIGRGREVVARRRDGSVFPVRLSVGVLEVGGRRLFTGFVHDMTELRRVERFALEDSLTGLPNRRAFEEMLETVLTRTQSAMLMLDVDHFKKVNDQLGHAAGDRALVTAAELIRGNLRMRDKGLCARIGGDEFAVLLPDTDLGAAEQVGARILADVAPALADVHPDCGLSIGVAWADAGEPPTHLRTLADDALYRAKEVRGTISR